VQRRSAQVLAAVCPAALLARDCHGVTPLHVAAAEGRTPAVALLLARGAKVKHAPYTDATVAKS
jgi:ankyrin repeat protein